jgi:TFIIF-interacting CTD phosphatase-like protein
MEIILDLDETCVSAIEMEKFDQVKNVSKYKYFVLNDEQGKPEFVVFLRPHLKEFLKFLQQNYNVSFWSAGEKTYVLDIVQKIVPDQEKIKMILWRDSCENCEQESNGMKNLEWVKEKRNNSKDKFILIDDLEENVDQENAIKIKPFDVLKNTDAHQDTELMRVQHVLKSL